MAVAKVYDDSIRLVRSERYAMNKGNGHALDLSTLSSGPYRVEILHENGIIHQQILIQK